MLKDLIYTYRQAFRCWMRQRTVQYTVEEAQVKQFFWAKVYAASAFGVLVFVSYSIHKRKGDFWFRKDIPEEQKSLAVVSDKNPVKVVKYVGFTKVDEVSYSKEEIRKFKNSYSTKQTE